MAPSGHAISACLIARDESEFIGTCISSIRDAVDEIVVVDTGSRDGTPSIARRLGARVVERAWPDDFALARNWALEEAKGAWVFILDADEQLVPSDAGKLKLLAASGKYDGYLVNIHHFADDHERHIVSQRVGLFRNDPRYRFRGAVHEQIAGAILESGGRLATSDVHLLHRGYEPWVMSIRRKHERNLRILRSELLRRPEDPTLHFYLAQEYYGLGRLHNAVEEYRRSFELAGWNWESRLAIAAVIRMTLAMAELNQWDDAFEVLERYRERFPQCTDLLYIEADFCLRLGDPRRALELLLQAIAQGDAPTGMFELSMRGVGTYRAWFAVGRAFEQVGRKPEAVSAYLQALRIEPRFKNAIRTLASLLLTSDPAERVLEFLVEQLPPRDPSVLAALWEALMEGAAFREALALTDQFDESNVGPAELRRGISFAALGLDTDAQNHLRRALGSGRLDGAFAIDAVLTSIGVGDRSLAQAWLKRIHPRRYADVLRVLARVSGVEHDPKDNGFAAVDSQSERTAPVSPSQDTDATRRVMWDLLDRAIVLGQFRTVDTLIGALVATGLPVDELSLVIGKKLHNRGYKTVAAELLLQAAQAGRYDAASLMALAQIALSRQDRESAEELLRKAVELDRSHPGPAMALAALLDEEGRASEALDVVDQAIVANPHTALLRQHRGFIARKLSLA